ncbi:16S rRNA (adenine(1518)-N(6)/adenine(1519)-N(6))-dimethyltransferase RsmA [Candidatus Micrarchaeota archaeon]|nr:16S rRNA (adenine(1518)-N(6)/adenine(1519)-N(6))-dimethyltransferase RsmA [Candidatus Micrarchaeota archaeon]
MSTSSRRTRRPASGSQPRYGMQETGNWKRRKFLGQHFLEDRNILALEAKLASPEHKTVLEIGPGDGRLTDAILALKPKRLVAVEKDARFASLLREKYAGRPEVEVVERDFLEFEPPQFDIAIGNIPYYISSDIVFRLAGMRFERAILMVQKEFAEKMAAKPGDRNYGRLSVTSQLAFGIRYERAVLRHLFRPAPEVDSAIITLKPTGLKLTQQQENVIRWLFSHKNKTVRNALLDSKMFEARGLDSLGPLLRRRARTLSKEECLEIAKALINV